MKKREESYVYGLAAFDQKHPRANGHAHGGHRSQRKGLFGLIDKVNEKSLDRYHRKKETRAKNAERRLLSFVDAMPNIGKVGGPIERGGWRNKAYEGWIVAKPDGSPDAIETFKNIENIGFEGVRWWVGEAGLAGGNFTPEFGEYVYDRFVRPNTGNNESYDTYVSKLKKELKSRKDLGPNAENKYGAFLVHRAMAYMLRERVPSLMVAIERTRLSETGIRGWERLRRDLSWGGNTSGAQRMDTAMKNIMLVEQKLRLVTSDHMRAGINEQIMANPEANPSLSAITYTKGENDYVLTRDRFSRELRALLTFRNTGTLKNEDGSTDNTQEYDDALRLFDATHKYLDEDYINKFAEKLRTNGQPEKFFPFAVAAEELDTSFLTYKSAGPDVMKRLLGEIGAVETNVTKGIIDEFMSKLVHVATVEHKHDTLIQGIEKVHHQLSSLHGEKYANEVADYMARIATAFFKKDWSSKGWIGKIINVGKPHSLAAEFAGGSWKSVWEWDVAEQDTFYRELDRLGLLPDKPVNLNILDSFEPRTFLGIKFGYKRVVTEAEEGTPHHTGLKIRKDMGATKWDIFKELAYKYGLPALLAISFMLLRKAIKEEEESKH
jgi:hypothetical protein